MPNPSNSEIFQFFDILFYTHKNRRQKEVSKEEYSKLTPETIKYLVKVWNYVKDFHPQYQRLKKIMHPDSNKEVTTDYDKINDLVSSGYFGGTRGGMLGSQGNEKATNLPMIPSQEVADNIKQAFF